MKRIRDIMIMCYINLHLHMWPAAVSCSCHLLLMYQVILRMCNSNLVK